MHWTKEVVKGLIDDVDGGDFLFGLSFFIILLLLFAGIAVGVSVDNAKAERLEYKEVMEKQCSADPNSEICKLASNKYFNVEEQSIVKSPLFGAAITLIVIVLLVPVFW